MKNQSIGIALVLVVIVTWVWYAAIRRATIATPPPQHIDSCKDSNLGYDIEDFHNSIAVIYDYSTISPQQLNDDIKVLQEDINQRLVSQLILVENKCENSDTSAAAVELVKTSQKMRIVVVQSDERVSTGRARISAVNKTAAPFILFVSAGSMPDSPLFLEHLLSSVKDKPSHVVVPSKKGTSDHYQSFTWRLRLQKSTSSKVVQQHKPLHLPLVDSSAFFIRSDMYKAVGGYDSFFYRRDDADRIAFSLAVWSCGGTIVRSECSHVKSTLDEKEEDETVSYLQYAKYIQQVYGGSLEHHFTYPGIEYYVPSSYDKHVITNRKDLFKSKGCMTLEWYALKFKEYLPVPNVTSRFYNPNYKPSLPVYERILPVVGKWFVLHAGQCVKVTEDSVLGLSWCPKDFKDTDIFIWKDNGQLWTKGDKCVTLRPTDSYLVVEDCKSADVTQQFKYDKSNRHVIAVQNGECVTHFSTDSGRQVLRPLPCERNAPFNKFVINDKY